MGAKSGEGKSSKGDGKAGKAASIRAFVALDLDSMSLRRVVRVSDRLRMSSGAPSASWTPAAKMHVTLKFMGALAEDQVVPLGKALAPLVEAAGPLGPWTMRLAAFPRVGDARIVVVELEDASGAMAKLADKIDRLASKHGVAREERDFRPHVTLARLKLAYDARRWLRPDLTDGAGDCRAAAVTLYRSEPAEDGSKYIPLARWELPPVSSAV